MLVTLKNVVFFLISTMVLDPLVSDPLDPLVFASGKIAKAFKTFKVSQTVSFDISEAFDRV